VGFNPRRAKGGKMTYDLIIIGAGPSGMTAGVFAARKGLNTLIISEDLGGQVNWTTDIENYMGYQEIDGQALMEKFETQVKELHLEEQLTTVNSIRKEGELFKVATKQQEYTAKAVIVSSGKKPRTLNVPGEVQFRNKGVSYCATCDGPLFRNIPVAVVGGGNSAVKSALDLANYASEIHLITNKGLTADQILIERLNKLEERLKKYFSHNVIEIKGNKSVEKVILEDAKTKQQFEVGVQGIFVEIGLDPNQDFLGEMVEKNEAGEIKVDCLCRTNVPGLYAAGDVTSVPEKQIIIAAGEGAKAALKVWEYLLKNPDPNFMH
jgi:NADH-dependent peroxiredoxin subunit F